MMYSSNRFYGRIQMLVEYYYYSWYNLSRQEAPSLFLYPLVRLLNEVRNSSVISGKSGRRQLFINYVKESLRLHQLSNVKHPIKMGLSEQELRYHRQTHRNTEAQLHRYTPQTCNTSLFLVGGVKNNKTNSPMASQSYLSQPRKNSGTTVATVSNTQQAIVVGRRVWPSQLKNGAHNVSRIAIVMNRTSVKLRTTIRYEQV